MLWRVAHGDLQCVPLSRPPFPTTAPDHIHHTHTPHPYSILRAPYAHQFSASSPASIGSSFSGSNHNRWISIGRTVKDWWKSKPLVCVLTKRRVFNWFLVVSRCLVAVPAVLRVNDVRLTRGVLLEFLYKRVECRWEESIYWREYLLKNTIYWNTIYWNIVSSYSIYQGTSIKSLQ